MHSILVIVHPADPTDALNRVRAEQFWPRIEGLLKKFAGIEVLGENALLISTAQGLTAFVAVCGTCQNSARKYRCLFFEEEPKWVSSTT